MGSEIGIIRYIETLDSSRVSFYKEKFIMTASQLLAVMNSPEYKFYDENYVFKKVKDFRGFSAVGVSSQVLCNRDEIKIGRAHV